MYIPDNYDQWIKYEEELEKRRKMEEKNERDDDEC